MCIHAHVFFIRVSVCVVFSLDGFRLFPFAFFTFKISTDWRFNVSIYFTVTVIHCVYVVFNVFIAENNSENSLSLFVTHTNNFFSFPSSFYFLFFVRFTEWIDIMRAYRLTIVDYFSSCRHYYYLPSFIISSGFGSFMRFTVWHFIHLLYSWWHASPCHQNEKRLIPFGLCCCCCFCFFSAAFEGGDAKVSVDVITYISWWWNQKKKKNLWSQISCNQVNDHSLSPTIHFWIVETIFSSLDSFHIHFSIVWWIFPIWLMSRFKMIPFFGFRRENFFFSFVLFRFRSR